MNIHFAMGAAMLCGSVATAHAALLDVQQDPGPLGVAPLNLTDGSWDKGLGGWREGGDYGLKMDGSGFWINEDWIGGIGQVADLATNLAPDPATLSTVLPIDIDKRVTNNAGFFWTAFEIRLIGAGLDDITNVTASTNAEFADVTVTDLGSDVLIRFDQAGGNGVAVGNLVELFFSFDFEGDLSSGINFRIVQTAIPTPGSFALIGVAGLAAFRRRR